MSEFPHLTPDLLQQFHRRQDSRHWTRLTVFLLLYAGSAMGTVWLAPGIASPWSWVPLLPLYIIAAASLHGISLFTHEAVHGTLSANRKWNAGLGSACALPVLQNFTAYRVLHLRHHQHLGLAGDPDHYHNYTQWSWMVFLMNWLRLLIGYPVYLVMIPILGFKHGTARDRFFIGLEVAAAVCLVSLALIGLPGEWLWHCWVMPMLCINFMVNLRGMSQHTLLEHADREVRGTRSILTYPLVRFFMCNENYHLEHHLYPGVPWYHLPAVHAALVTPLRKLEAPYIRSYGAFLWEFIRGSLQRSPLGSGRKR